MEEMVGRRVVFGEIIATIGFALTPVDAVVAKAGAVADPVVPHVDGFAAALADGVVGDASGTCVVGLDGGGGLGVAHIA